MKTTKTALKSAAVMAGAAIIPTAAVFMSGVLSNAIAGSPITDDFAVTANVSANCNFSTGVADLAFGEYDPSYANLTAPLDSTTTFKIRCNKGATAVMSLGLGLQPAVSQRKLIGASPSNLLNYDLYSNAGRTTAWNTTTTVSYVATTGSAVEYTIYGRIPAGQDVSVDSYSDTVTLSASF